MLTMGTMVMNTMCPVGSSVPVLAGSDAEGAPKTAVIVTIVLVSVITTSVA